MSANTNFTYAKQEPLHIKTKISLKQEISSLDILVHYFPSSGMKKVSFSFILTNVDSDRRKDLVDTKGASKQESLSASEYGRSSH